MKLVVVALFNLSLSTSSVWSPLKWFCVLQDPAAFARVWAEVADDVVPIGETGHGSLSGAGPGQVAALAAQFGALRERVARAAKKAEKAQKVHSTSPTSPNSRIMSRS